MRKIDPALQERLATLIASMGYELIGCEMIPQGRHMIFRLYIDSEVPVTIDHCSAVSRQVSAMLDVEDAFSSHYTLEVSSPGIDRPLFAIEHFQKQLGKQIKLKLYVPIDGRRQFKGHLLKVEGENIHLLPEGAAQEIILPFSAIEKANVIGEVHL
jgi:ribosome maturation factor RimP